MYKILVLTVVLLLKITNSYAEVIKNIEIVGNNRVSKATILNFSELKKGDDVSSSKINESLKSLYNTNFFEDIKINIKNNLLTISVKEYPVIQEINFKGIKRKQTIEDLKEQISLKEKNPFNESLIKNDLNKILNILKNSGFYFADAKVQVEENQNDTINIIYNVSMGEKATIKEIQFKHTKFCLWSQNNTGNKIWFELLEINFNSMY